MTLVDLRILIIIVDFVEHPATIVRLCFNEHVLMKCTQTLLIYMYQNKRRKKQMKTNSHTFKQL